MTKHFPPTTTTAFLPVLWKVMIMTFIFQTFSSTFFLVFLVDWNLSHSTDLMEKHLYKRRDKSSVHLTQRRTHTAFTYHSDLEGLNSTCTALSLTLWALLGIFEGSGPAMENRQPHGLERDLGCHHPTGWARWRWHTVTNQRLPPLLQPSHRVKGIESLLALQ